MGNISKQETKAGLNEGPLHEPEGSQQRETIFCLACFKSQLMKIRFCKPMNVLIDLTIDGWRPALGGSTIATIFLSVPETRFFIKGKQSSTF